MYLHTTFCLLYAIISVAVAECPDGWTVFEGSCYIFPAQSANFLDANSHCSLLGGHLVSIGSQSENAFITNFLNAQKDHFHWIGLNDIAVENVWDWEDTGEKAEFTNWAPGQPQGGAVENCVVINAPGLVWHDVPCDIKSNFICEKSQHENIEIVG